MSHDDVTKIKVDKQSVGIIGLNRVMEEMAAGYGEKPEEEVRLELVKRLSKRNYIPDRARENYGKAFLREFNKFLGKPYEEEDSAGLEIKVLGAGCVQCDRLEREIVEVTAEMNLTADIEHVRDLKEIGKYGVMGTPGLVINGKVKAVGQVPPKHKIVEWLKEV